MVDIVINDVRPRIQYVGDGVQTSFIYPFPVFKAVDLEVYLDDRKQEAGFSVNDAGLSEGGSVVFDVAPVNTAIITLRRILVIERTSDFQEGGSFRASVVNNELDRIIAIQQQIADEQLRSLVLAPQDADSILTLPVTADRAGRIMGFDETGKAVASVSVSVIESFEGSAASAVQAAVDAQAAKEAAEAAAILAQTFDPSAYRLLADEIQTADVADGAITAAKIDPTVSLGGPSLGTNSIIRTNADTIAEDITIPVGTNGMSAGPITIADGFTLTINGEYTVV